MGWKNPYLHLHLPLEKFYIHLNVRRNNFDLIKTLLCNNITTRGHWILFGFAVGSHFNVRMKKGEEM